MQDPELTLFVCLSPAPGCEAFKGKDTQISLLHPLGARVPPRSRSLGCILDGVSGQREGGTVQLRQVGRKLMAPQLPPEKGQQCLWNYLREPRSREGSCILGQCHVVHHALCHLREQLVLQPMSAQLPKQVRDQVVPLPALLDQGSQLGLGGWEWRHSQVGPPMQDILRG